MGPLQNTYFYVKSIVGFFLKCQLFCCMRKMPRISSHFLFFLSFEFNLVDIKPRIHACAKWFANHSQTVCKPNACMCGWDCKPALCHPQMVHIPFAANRNLSVFCMNTKRTQCAWSGVKNPHTQIWVSNESSWKWEYENSDYRTKQNCLYTNNSRI